LANDEKCQNASKGVGSSRTQDIKETVGKRIVLIVQLGRRNIVLNRLRRDTSHGVYIGTCSVGWSVRQRHDHIERYQKARRGGENVKEKVKKECVRGCGCVEMC